MCTPLLRLFRRLKNMPEIYMLHQMGIYSSLKVTSDARKTCFLAVPRIEREILNYVAAYFWMILIGRAIHYKKCSENKGPCCSDSWKYSRTVAYDERNL